MNRFMVGVFAAFALSSGVALAKGPLAGHPNLKAAHHHVKQAIEKVTAAQVANEFDMEGHAAKAKELLEQAEKEIGQAAKEATENKK
jgi:hypothetical protein